MRWTRPARFRAEAGSAPLFTRLRDLDGFRFRRDPWLRASYAGAACVLGVAPYVRDILSAIPLKRFESVLELGIDDVEPTASRTARARPVAAAACRARCAHQGAARRGARHGSSCAICRVTLTSAGGGEEIAICRAEAAALGLTDRVTFLDRQPRERIEALYAQS